MTRKPQENMGGPLAPWLRPSSTLLSGLPSAASLPALSAGQWVQPPSDEQPPSTVATSAPNSPQRPSLF